MMDVVAIKRVDPRTGTITLTGHGPERLRGLCAAGLLAGEARADAEETLEKYDAMRRELAICKGLRRKQGRKLNQYREERLAHYREASRGDLARIRRRAIRREPGISDAAYGFCILGIAVGSSIVTIVAAMMM